MSKVVVTAAVTGAIHVPSLSPYLPVTPEEIADQAVGAVKAGASVVHVHTRDPKDGHPNNDADLYRQINKNISERCDGIICITTGGKLGSSVEDRVRPIASLKPELASLNSGSINFAIHPLANKVQNPKYDWEIPYLHSTEDLVFANTFKTMKTYLGAMNGAGAKPEFEVYDVGMINNLRHLIDVGALKAPIYLQFVMGILGGIPATPGNLVFLVETAKRQLGEGNFVWSCCAAGKVQMQMMCVAMALGGNVRVGLEDNLYAGPGRLAKNSAEQVEKIVRIANELSLEIATPAEAREILGLKGGEKVGWL